MMAAPAVAPLYGLQGGLSQLCQALGSELGPPCVGLTVIRDQRALGRAVPSGKGMILQEEEKSKAEMIDFHFPGV